jgi:hypothetical protein
MERENEYCLLAAAGTDLHGCQAEPAVTAGRAGMTAFRAMKSLQPARQLILVVRRGGVSRYNRVGLGGSGFRS